MPTNPCLQPAHILAALLRAREVTATELLEAHIARNARLHPQINAIVLPQLEAARARARAADEAAARGEFWGPLHGLPMTVKESFDVLGLPTCVGDPALSGYRARDTALAVQRLEAAGAIIMGKTNLALYMSDLQSFNAAYGVTRNPWDLGRSCGGSSGGSAAALAAGLTTLELGSDLAGSIRGPAHFCGVYGHKPSWGLLPTRGHFGPPGRRSEMDLTVVGPMARTAEDLALMLPLLAGPQFAGDARWQLALPAPRAKALKDFRVGVWLQDADAPLDASLRRVLDATVTALKAAGVQVIEGGPDGLAIRDFYADYFQLMASAIGAISPQKLYGQARWAARFGRLLGKTEVNTLFGHCQGMTISHRDWVRTHERRCQLQARLARYFTGVDVLLMPVTPTAALPHHGAKPGLYSRRIPCNGGEIGYAEQMKWIALASHAGLPATVAPIGHTEAGLPVGVQIVGAELDDLTTIAFAQALAGVVGGYRVPPLD